jgi:hypothetical protein
MKMSVEHYAALSKAVTSLLDVDPDLVQRFKEKGYSPMRIRWDAYWACDLDKHLLYSAGYSDDHIDTALRKIVADWEATYARQQ